MRKYIFFSILAVFFMACEEQEIGPTVQLGAAPQITQPTAGASFVLSEDEQDNSLGTFAWSAADFGFQAAVTYTLEMDKVGNSFAEAITLATANSLESTELTVGRLNNILISKEFPPQVSAAIELRVCASISDEVETLCSNVMTIEVTPYPAEVNYPVLNIPGNYQDWDPGNPQTVIFSRKSDEIYEGYIYMGLEENLYKFAKGSWDENWGDDEPDGTLNPNGTDIASPGGAGMYFLHADLNALEYFAEQRNWGVIGDATPTGWDADTDMTWDADKFALTVTLDLGEGEIKFRANDDWAVNFGDEFGNGQLQQDGANIVVPSAGNYTIDLHLSQANYGYTLTKN